MSKPKDLVQILAAVFFIVAIAVRLGPNLYNLQAIGALGMFVGCYWSVRMGILFSVAAMALSDCLGHFMGIPSMGFYSVWLTLTVYAAMAGSAFVGKLVDYLRRKKAPLGMLVPAGAIVTTAIFFLITNFASWLDPQMGYPATFAGLMQCLWMALPFAKGSLLGNLIFSGVFFGAFSLLKQRIFSRESSWNNAE